MKILITGVPGTGKTTLSQKIVKRLNSKGQNYKLIRINDIAKRFKLDDGPWGSVIVDIEKTEDEINKMLENMDNVIIEGHLGCDMKLNVDMVIVLRCDPYVLKERLKQRGYPREKIEENFDAEMIDYVLIHSEDNYSSRGIPVIELSTENEKDFKNAEEKILEMLKNKNKK